MKHYLNCSTGLLLGIVLILGSGAEARSELGPLHTANRFPLHMMVLTPRPIPAELPGQGVLEVTLALEYSSIFFDHRNARWDFLLDMEILIAELSVRYGLTEKVAILMDAPMISMGGGFMDGFLQNYHNGLGVSNYGRESRPADVFAYRATKDGAMWVRGKADTFRPGDLRLSAQVELPSMQWGDQSVHVAALVTLKVPTGDAGTGLGSGHYDAGLYVPMQWGDAPWTFYLMPGAAWINDPDTLGASISARNSFGLFAGAAYRSSSRWRWLAQANYYSSPFERSGLDELDAGALELSFGLQRTLNRALSVEFAFCEDLTRPVPDFTVRFGMTWRFGIGRAWAKEETS